MRRWKLHAWFLLLSLLILSCSILVSGAGQPKAENQRGLSLRQLLAGTSSDYQGVLSCLSDSELPKALGCVEALKFKALHGDTPLSQASIEAFHRAIQCRLAISKTISLQPSPQLATTIPGHDEMVGDTRIRIPAYFTSHPPGLLDYGPTGEAGSPLPAVWARFSTRPSSVVLTIDGKPVPGTCADQSTFVFEPFLMAANILAVGTHTATLKYSTSDKEQSFSWQFTVGIGEFPLQEVADLPIVASFTVPAATMFPDIRAKGSITVLVRNSNDGRCVLEYELVVGGATWRTTSLRNVRLLLGRSETGTVTLSPKTPCMFPGNPLTLSYTYSGPGAIEQTEWVITGEVFNTPTVSLTFPDRDLHVSLKLTLTLAGPDGPTTGFAGTERAFRAILVRISPEKDRMFLPFKKPAPTSFPVQAKHQVYLYGYSSGFFVPTFEGMEYPFEDQGLFVVHKQRWRIAAGTAEATIDGANATASTFLLKTPGVVEAVTDLDLSFFWGDERYDWSYVPLATNLLCSFPVAGEANFKTLPTGIIDGTKRRIDLDSFSLTINGTKRIFSQKADFNLDPPWLVATSTLFPDTPAVQLKLLYPLFLQQTTGEPTPFQPPDLFHFFIPPDRTEGQLSRIDESFGFRLYGILYGWGKASTKVDPEAYPQLFAISEWLRIPMYPSPADLVDVEIDPTGISSMQEGQELKLTGRIVPKDGLGTGELSQDKNDLDLLAGYTVEKPPALSWKADLASQTKFTGENWEFKFLPGLGTGTYEITAETEFEVVEKNTDTMAQVTGKGQKVVLVEEGLRILSPAKAFAYPAGRAIPLKTTVDKNPEQWKKITWSLNGKPWKPAEDEPPAFLAIEDPNDQVILEARLTSTDSNGQAVELFDKVEFAVKPISAILSPSNKVVLREGKPVVVKLSVKLGKTDVEACSTIVDWSALLRAKIEKVDWTGTFGHAGAGALKPRPDQFNAEATFEKPGALTIQASVTVRVWSIDTSHPYEETFTFTALRSDIWGIDIQLATYTAHLPRKAIAGVGRSFYLSKVDLSVNGKQYIWGEMNPLGERDEFPITLPPALPGVSSVKCDGLTLLWSCDANSLGNKALYQPLMKSRGIANVLHAASLKFDSNPGEFPLYSVNTPVEIFPVNVLVDSKVDPASFVAPLTGYRSLLFSLKAKEDEDWGGSTFVLDRGFRLNVVTVNWFEQGLHLGSENPLQYPSTIGEKQSPNMIEARASGDLIEQFPKPVNGSFDDIVASATVTHIQPRIEISMEDLFNNHVVGLSDPASKAFIHFNLDNDCGQENGTDPVPDYSLEETIVGEDDLVQLRVSLFPLNDVGEGKVTLSRSNENVRVWLGKNKNGGKKLVDQNECSWDFSDADQLIAFYDEKDRLFVEGYKEGLSVLTMTFSLGKGLIQSKSILVSSIGMNSGRQPLAERRKVLKDDNGLDELVDCEWSVLNGPSTAYNCIAWSIASDSWVAAAKSEDESVIYPPHWVFIDEIVPLDEHPEFFGNKHLEIQELEAFFVNQGFEMLEGCSPDCEIVYFSNFHAARRSNSQHGDGQWKVFQSKIGPLELIEHRLDQVGGDKPGENGRPFRYFRRKK